MIYKFIDDQGTFTVKNPEQYNLYFPLTNQDGTLLSSISPNLAGDIKQDNDHFLTLPASIEDLRSNLLCRREFFLKLQNNTIRLSYPAQDILEAGLLYHKINKNLGRLKAEIVNFVPYNLGVEVMWIKITNTSGRAIKITPTSFIPLFGRSEKNLRDHRHVSSLLNRIELNKFGISLEPTMVFDERGHRENKTIYFVLGYENQGQPPVGQFPTLDYFFGQSDIISPEAIEKKIPFAQKKLPEFDGKEVCAAFRFRERVLQKGQQVNYFLFLGIAEDSGSIQNIFRQLNAPQKIKQQLLATQKFWQDHLAQLEFDFADRDFNSWLCWVKLEPTLRRLFGCSFLPHFDYGKGGRGWRDLWQDALTLTLTEPQKARDFILHNFSGVRIDGSNATIITKDGDFLADRNRINRVWMDHGIWPYLTLKTYIHKTGDLALLLKETGYFKDHQLRRGRAIDVDFQQKDYLLRDKSQRICQGSILEHLLIQHLVQFFNVGRHNIIRLENADWNDGLDMAPEFGESVASSFMYAHNLRDIAVLLEELRKTKRYLWLAEEIKLLLDRLGQPIDYLRYQEKQERLEQYFAKTEKISGRKIKLKIDDLIGDLKDKAEHLSSWLKQKEWLREGFFNGYYDNKCRRAEGGFKKNIKIMLPGQVFAIKSGVADREQIKKIWISLNRYLKDKKLGGFRLNTDFRSLYLDLGRAFGFAYGDKENGAFFNHMVVMLANALYQRGFLKEGFATLNSIYQMSTHPRAQIYPMIPEYFNSQGKGLYLYLTGSASWYIYTLIEEVLGIKFLFGDLYLEPKLLAENFSGQEIGASFNLFGKRVNVKFIPRNKTNRPYQIKEVFLNRQRVYPRGDHYIIKRTRLKKKENLIQMYLT